MSADRHSLWVIPAILATVWVVLLLIVYSNKITREVFGDFVLMALLPSMIVQAGLRTVAGSPLWLVGAGAAIAASWIVWFGIFMGGLAFFRNLRGRTGDGSFWGGSR